AAFAKSIVEGRKALGITASADLSLTPDTLDVSLGIAVAALGCARAQVADPLLRASIEAWLEQLQRLRVESERLTQRWVSARESIEKQNALISVLIDGRNTKDVGLILSAVSTYWGTARMPAKERQ